MVGGREERGKVKKKGGDGNRKGKDPSQNSTFSSLENLKRALDPLAGLGAIHRMEISPAVYGDQHFLRQKPKEGQWPPASSL